jgi:hypothetical protein
MEAEATFNIKESKRLDIELAAMKRKGFYMFDTINENPTAQFQNQQLPSLKGNLRTSRDSSLHSARHRSKEVDHSYSPRNIGVKK